MSKINPKIEILQKEVGEYFREIHYFIAVTWTAWLQVSLHKKLYLHLYCASLQFCFFWREITNTK